MMNAMQSRSYERSSSFLSDARKHADEMAVLGQLILKQVHVECADTIEAIWNRPNDDEKETSFGLLPVMPASKKADIEKTIAELSGKPIRQAKPALPVGVEMPADEIEQPEMAAKLLGISADK